MIMFIKEDLGLTSKESLNSLPWEEFGLFLSLGNKTTD